jgi:hypothetical protein
LNLYNTAKSQLSPFAERLASGANAYRPLPQNALQVIADYLWPCYPIDSKTRQSPAILAPDADLSVSTNQTRRERELAWARESFPHDTANLADVIEGIRKTIDPLLEAAHTQVDRPGAHCDPLLPVAGQAATLRQIFLSLVTAVAQAVPVRIQTRISPGARLSQA